MIKNIGLVPKLIIAIILGTIIGLIMPPVIIQILITIAGLFSSFLKFFIPLMIIGFIVTGIADLAQGAGKLLGITTAIAYASTVIAGSLALFFAMILFPYFINTASVAFVDHPEEGMLAPFFNIPLEAMLDVTAAIVFAFVMGLSISTLRAKGKGETTHRFFKDFSEIVMGVLSKVIIPLLPLYIMGTFANMSHSGQVFSILSVFWKVFAIVLILHLAYTSLLFFIAGIVGKKNPFAMIKNQIPGYLTALGTQSSGATIPVNLDCAEKNGVSREIREFAIPLCATIHLAGSIITVICCVTAVLMLNSMDYSITTMLPFIFTLGIAMIAAPGAPGGAIMSALPFLPMIGIGSETAIASLLIALYITQDSFGTAANVSGDNAIAIIVDSFYKRLN